MCLLRKARKENGILGPRLLIATKDNFMQNTTTIELPEKVTDILHTIMAAGYEAYAVGGCIRDTLLHRSPNDWDITTNASPLQVKSLFRRTIDTGIQHGTVTVMLGQEGFEVTTYRIDGDYSDGRHPNQVTYTKSLTEDLKRRDFTINAMAYNETDGLVDIFGGQEDLVNGIVRCVGDPRQRFSEDALRILRAVRFSAQLGYRIDDSTRSAIRELAPTLRKISAERIQTELVKLLVSGHPEELLTAYEDGITAVILPEFDLCMQTEQHNPHHLYSVGMHTMKAVEQVRADKVLRLAMLFHDMGKPSCKQADEEGIDHFHAHPAVSEEIALSVLHRLKFDNDTMDMVRRLVRYHDYYIEANEKSVRRAMHKIGEDAFPLLLEVKRADMLAQSDFLRKEKEENLKEVNVLYQMVLSKKQCVSLKDLAVNGSDLIRETGAQPGPSLGRILQELLQEVIDDPSLNERTTLLQRALEIQAKAQENS